MGISTYLKKVSKTKQPVKLGFYSVTAFVVANMIGAGVFTSLGFQLSGGIRSVFALLMLWLVGGITAFCGSLVYGELGAAMPRSGGEYHYLSKIYHPAVGFLSGWISLTIGFAAPVALACMALGSYLGSILTSVSPILIAAITLMGITLVHSLSVRTGSKFQNVFTIFKVLLILAFVLFALWFAPQLQQISLMPHRQSWSEIVSPAFAISLIYVSYSYSGWNASAYIAGEIKKPQRLLPLSLLTGTVVVTILYLLLNYMFLQTTPIAELEGELEIGFIAASKVMGAKSAGIMSLLISILLVSSISSMVFVGPRISQVMGEDIHLLRFLSYRNSKNIPINAVLLQYAISMVFILTGSFERVLTYSAFILNIFTFLTVFGVFIHRRKSKLVKPTFKTWAYPIPPIIFLLLSAWTMYFLLVKNTAESLYGLATIGIGLIIYVANYVVKQKALKAEKQMKPTTIIIRLFVGAVLFSSMLSCGNQNKSDGKTESAPSIENSTLPAVVFDKSITDAARFVAGMPIDSTSRYFSLTQTQAWQNYAAQCDSNWQNYHDNVTQHMKNWVRKEIPDADKYSKTLFYPFSGPDFLNANTYFPHAAQYIMFGLEPHGSIPQPEKAGEESMGNYLNAYSDAINSVVQQSFFYTNKMKKKFESKELNGATPLLLLFLARADKKIVSVKPFRFGEDGSLDYLQEFAAYKGEAGYGSGVEILFCDADGKGEIKKIIYFSANIADGGLEINQPTRKFLQTVPSPCIAFIKSATYLMHKSYFSIIRNTVLNNADLILQDDSGIKYAYFNPEIWDIQLYGSYQKPIQLFAEHYEPDLYDAYQNKTVKQLPFRTGYASNSNMLLAIKK